MRGARQVFSALENCCDNRHLCAVCGIVEHAFRRAAARAFFRR